MLAAGGAGSPDHFTLAIDSSDDAYILELFWGGGWVCGHV